MSEDNTKNQNENPENGSGSGAAGGENEGQTTNTQMTIEDAMKEIERLRKENAAKRVRSRAAENELAEFKKWKESQMTDAERLQAERESLVNELRAERVSAACDKYNVPEERRQFVTGNTKEEIELAAKVLGEEKKPEEEKSGSRNPNLFPGTRGNPVGSSGGKTNFDEILRERLRS